jgi:hypothetical protein
MAKKEKISVRQLACYMSEKDFQKFEEAYKTTLCRNRSQYMRKLLLGKPVTVHLRNSSIDDFIEIAVKIRKDFAGFLAAPSLSPIEKEELKEHIAIIQSQLIKVVAVCSQK